MSATTPKKKKKAGGFGRRSGKGYEELEVPSGQTIKVRRPGVQGLIKEGILESLDALTGIVQSETIPTAEGKPVVDASKLLADPDALMKVMSLMDDVVLAVVVGPKLHKAPTQADLDEWNNAHPDEVPKEDPDDLRDDELAYVDWVDDEDKMFIFNFAIGGTRSLARFREESEVAVAGLLPSEADGPTS